MISILVFDMWSYTVLASIENCLQSQVHPTMQVSQPQQQQGPTSNSLSPIVEDPDRAYVSDDVCQHLHAFPDKASFSEMPCTLLGSDTSLGYLL